MRRWVMSYARQTLGPALAARATVGSCVVDRHPLLVVAEWNRRPRDYPVTTALTWYAELGEGEQAELVAAGLDLAAQYAEVRVS